MNQKLKRQIVLIVFIVATLFALILLISNFTKYIIIFSFFILCIISMLPLNVISWSGIFDLNILLTVYVTQTYGIGAGFLISNASWVGLLLTGNIDGTIVIDCSLSPITVILATLCITLHTGILITILIYTIGYIIGQYIFGELEWSNILWVITHFMWYMLLLKYFIP
jgi:hypothetical protein